MTKKPTINASSRRIAVQRQRAALPKPTYLDEQNAKLMNEVVNMPKTKTAAIRTEVRDRLKERSQETHKDMSIRDRLQEQVDAGMLSIPGFNERLRKLEGRSAIVTTQKPKRKSKLNQTFGPPPTEAERLLKRARIREYTLRDAIPALTTLINVHSQRDVPVEPDTIAILSLSISLKDMLTRIQKELLQHIDQQTNRTYTKG